MFFIMKIILLTLSIFFLSSCASRDSKVYFEAQNKPKLVTDATENQVIATEFTDEGIKLIYTSNGKLVGIEVFGQAEIWRGNPDAIAEADAMAKLTKFIYGTNIATERKVRLINRSIEATQNKSINKYISQDGTVNLTDKIIENLAQSPSSKEQSDKSDRNLRNAIAINETVTNTITSLTSKGKLIGVRKIRDYQRNDDKIYVAVYAWSDKGQDASEYIRKKMLNQMK